MRIKLKPVIPLVFHKIPLQLNQSPPTTTIGLKSTKTKSMSNREEKPNESALENNAISMLSSSLTFASDLIDACANASAEMLIS